MKKLTILLSLCLIYFWSCSPDEKILHDQEVTFSISGISPAITDGGRVASGTGVKSVLVTIKDNSGNVVADRKALELHKFNDEYLSLPLTLKTIGSSQYRLTEFLVTNDEGQVKYATPRQGSKLAHIVSDPLDIEFAVSKDEIATVTPEVLAVDENTSPEDFGYGQFGFKIINAINSVFSAFIKGTDNFELTDAHLKIEGLSSSQSDATVVWTYESNLEAKANVLVLKKADDYRITATKTGYKTWTETRELSNESKIEIIFDKTEETIDVYVAGYDGARATYWKNGIPTQLENSKISSATSIYVFNDDVYVTGYNSEPPLFWKNDEKVYLPIPSNGNWGETQDIIVNDNEVIVCGRYVTSTRNIPCYWRSGVRTELQIPSPFITGDARKMTLEGSDVYIVGYIMTSNTSQPRAALWKNGEFISMEIPINYSVSMARGVKVSNGDVYVSGYIEATPYPTGNPTSRSVYWKNGALKFITQTGPSGASSLDVVANNIYIPYGTRSNGNSQAWYWKNGESVLVEEGALVYTYGLSVSNDDVYLVGTYKQNLSEDAIACYWVNGKRVPLLSTQESQAVSCFVVRSN